MSYDADQAVGEIATKYPLATRVFHRHGIDFCCGGGIPLRDACNKSAVDVDKILAEIKQELSDSDFPDERWDKAPLPDLIRHILVTFHEPLKEEMPRLIEMAKKVNLVHGEKDPKRLHELFKVVSWLCAELDQHLLKEEEVLFPMVIAGDGMMADGPISIMEDEHVAAGEALRKIRELTRDFEVPAEACNTWRALWHGLEALEQALHQHIHLENNILFPRALSEG